MSPAQSSLAACPSRGAVTARAVGAGRKARIETAPGQRDFAHRRRASISRPNCASFQRALRSRVERRDALLDIVRAVNTTLEPPRSPNSMVERAATWVPAPCWAVVSSDLSGQLSVLAERGLMPDMGPAVYAIARLGDASAARSSCRPICATTIACTTASVGAVIAFPLICRGRRVGALIGLDRAPSSREPRLAPAILRAVRVLLEPAAVALDNALLLKRAEALSVTDDLTQLYNSRYLNQVLRRETKRASRSGRPLSLLFIDLDGFKAVNDTHGHLCGSRALVEAAAVIAGSARETDVVARFGGDEFALVLPDTGGEGAFAVGERIRERIAAHVVSGRRRPRHSPDRVGRRRDPARRGRHRPKN